MRSTIVSLMFFCIPVLFSQCTGLNVMNIFGGTSTHPMPAYSDSRLLGALNKGGLLLHRNSAPGQIGQDTHSDKKGRACSHAALWLIAFGDSSIETARINAGITKIASVDHEILSVIGFIYHRQCTVVTGE